MYILFKKPLLYRSEKENIFSHMKRGNDYYVFFVDDNVPKTNTMQRIAGKYSSFPRLGNTRPYGAKKITIVDNKVVIDDNIICTNAEDCLLTNMDILQAYKIIDIKSELSVKDVEEHFKVIDTTLKGSYNAIFSEFLANHKTYVTKKARVDDRNTVVVWNKRSKQMTSSLTDGGNYNSVTVNEIHITNDYAMIKPDSYKLSNTEISCGVTQLFDLDNLLWKMSTLGEEELKAYIPRFKQQLTEQSMGAVVIYSTVKKVYKQNKATLALITEGLTSTTRYTKNFNSGNKIGVTTLILQ